MKSEKMNMKAIRIHQYGGPEVLAQVEMQRPTPGHDEVLIKVHAASVNPIDWKLRAGHVKEVFPLSFPSTLGWDVSGTVEEAGDNVTQFKRGDEVYALVKGGGYAEYVVAKATVVAKKPRTLDHVHAAAVPVAGLTALQALFEVAQLRAGQKVLIHAAAGGVGNFAVHLAKERGAYVIGTASAKNHTFLSDLGVDKAVDYQKTRFEEAVRDVDVVLDSLACICEAAVRDGKALLPFRAPIHDVDRRLGLDQAAVIDEVVGRRLLKRGIPLARRPHDVLGADDGWQAGSDGWR